jgi:hypothetical protein
MASNKSTGIMPEQHYMFLIGCLDQAIQNNTSAKPKDLTDAVYTSMTIKFSYPEYTKKRLERKIQYMQERKRKRGVHKREIWAMGSQALNLTTSEKENLTKAHIELGISSSFVGQESSRGSNSTPVNRSKPASQSLAVQPVVAKSPLARPNNDTSSSTRPLMPILSNRNKTPLAQSALHLSSRALPTPESSIKDLYHKRMERLERTLGELKSEVERSNRAFDVILKSNNPIDFIRAKELEDISSYHRQQRRTNSRITNSPNCPKVEDLDNEIRFINDSVHTIFLEHTLVGLNCFDKETHFGDHWMEHKHEIPLHEQLLARERRKGLKIALRSVLIEGICSWVFESNFPDLDEGNSKMLYERRTLALKRGRKYIQLNPF